MMVAKTIKRKCSFISVTLLLFALLSSCRKPQQARNTSATDNAQRTARSVSPAFREPMPSAPEIKILMHNVILNERPGFQLRVRWLRGQMRPIPPDVIPSFDEPTSFVLDIQDGVIATSLKQISALLNSSLLKDTPLQKVSLTDENKELKLSGTLHKGIALPIEMISEVSAAPDGRIRLHVVKMRVLKLPVTGLLESFHVTVGDLIGAKGAEGVQATDDNIYLEPGRILPAPAIRGKLSDAHIGPKTSDLITVFGEARPEVVRVQQWRNFIRLLGGTLSFGKLTMHQTDIFLIDTSNDEWFSFDLTRYQEQLVNGRIQMTPEAGLRIFMPDIERIPRTEANRRINVQWMKNRNIPPPAD